jgi:hypothetical protein
MAIVARLLRGEPLELVARETNVSIARLTEWRECALQARLFHSDRKVNSSDVDTTRECRNIYIKGTS